MNGKGMKARAGKMLGTALAVLLAVGLCVNAGPLSLVGGWGAFAAGAGSAFAADDDASASGGDNSWQIVSGEYDAKYATSQGLSDSELVAHNFVASNDGDDGSQVHVTKTVEPTTVEDEFVVHLSVDTSATSKQVTDYYSFFVNAPYEGTESNTYKAFEAGSVTTKDAGAFGVVVSGTNQDKNSAVFDIYDPEKHRIAKDVTLYWNKANNFTIVLDLSKLGVAGVTGYVLMGISVRFDEHNDLYLTQEAYELINKAIQGKTKWGEPTRLTSVTDVMGDGVEYIGGATADGGTVDYNSTTRTLIWNPAYSASCTEGEVETEVDTETNDEGAVTKVTVTQRKWYYGAASLTYKVRLNTQALDFASSYNPATVTNSNFTNNKAMLSYSYSVDGGTSYKSNTVDFPKPEVKGILYDLQALKTNEIQTPLAGATFKLTRSWTDSFGEAHTDVVSDSLTSDEHGYVKYGSLPWGTYTLEETAAPSGHVLSDNAKVTFELCYTNNSGALTDSTIVADANHAMLKGSTQTVVNERVKTDVTLLKVDASDNTTPLSGARFALYCDDGDGAFDEASDLLDANKVGDITTGQDGKDVFEKLTVGTYYLKETFTPAGYELNSKVYRIDVYDVKGEAGGTADNMIRVGDADGSNMQPPNTANQVTIADRPIPALPVTAGPGARGVIDCGFGLIAIGAFCFAAYELHLRRRVDAAKHRAW